MLSCCRAVCVRQPADPNFGPDQDCKKQIPPGSDSAHPLGKLWYQERPPVCQRKPSRGATSAEFCKHWGGGQSETLACSEGNVLTSTGQGLDPRLRSGSQSTLLRMSLEPDVFNEGDSPDSQDDHWTYERVNYYRWFQRQVSRTRA